MIDAMPDDRSSKRCWWCGSSGPLSSEHKFKRTDLKRVRGDDGEDLSWLGAGEVREVRSDRKSHLVRFTKSLCRSCNDSRSQPFDSAYDRFAEYVWARPLWNPRRVDLREVFPEGGRAEAVNLGRYVVKHFGCRIVQDGYPVPRSFVDFLNGGPEPSDVRLVFISHASLLRRFRDAVREGDDVRGVGMLEALGLIDSASGDLTGYSSALLVGHFGIGYEWVCDAVGSEVFFAMPRPRVYRGDAWRRIGGQRARRWGGLQPRRFAP